MSHTVKILMNEFVTHDVRRFIVSRPEGFDYKPGQGVTLAINESDWAGKKRPFTPTNLPNDEVLEFIIKVYPDHNGVTQKLSTLAPGAELLMSDAFGALTYQGPGWFIAGGAGITPMLAILRQLAAEDRLADHGLIFANKSPADIIGEKELRHYLGDNCVFLCDQAEGMPYPEGRIDRDFLAEHISDFDQHFYTCGPPKFDKAVKAALEELGATPDRLIFDQ